MCHNKVVHVALQGVSVQPTVERSIVKVCNITMLKLIEMCGSVVVN